jgi:hypothetical protein
MDKETKRTLVDFSSLAFYLIFAILAIACFVTFCLACYETIVTKDSEKVVSYWIACVSTLIGSVGTFYLARFLGNYYH